MNAIAFACLLLMLGRSLTAKRIVTTEDADEKGSVGAQGGSSLTAVSHKPSGRSRKSRRERGSTRRKSNTHEGPETVDDVDYSYIAVENRSLRNAPRGGDTETEDNIDETAVEEGNLRRNSSRGGKGSTINEYSEDVEACSDSDCTYSISDGCVPIDADRRIKCAWRSKFGDLWPSQSCRCAGAGLLTAKYGSIEEAFEKLSGEDAKIDLNEFTELMAKYNVSPHTAAWEFRQADQDGNGVLDKDEFIKNVSQLLAATEGGDKSLGSSSSRCCCKKKVSQPDMICVDWALQVFTTSVPWRSDEKYEVPEWRTQQTHVASGSQCHGHCRTSTETKMIYKLGQASTYNTSAQVDSQKKLVRFGDALYENVANTYSRCVENVCSRSYHRRSYQCGSSKHRRTCHRRVCRSHNHCRQSKQFLHCGHTLDEKTVGLDAYRRAGTVGTCIEEESLETKWFVKHKVCPKGTYHRNRKDSKLQMCDCNDECP